MKSKSWAVGLACSLLFCVAPASALAGSISGTITAASGAPIAHARACVRKVDGNEQVSCAQANEEGEYAITAIVPGGYRLYFEGPQGGSEYVLTYFPEKTTYAGAEVFQIGSAEIVEVNGTLLSAGRIEGTLTTEGEVPSYGEICAYGPYGSKIACDYLEGGSGYRIGGLAPGSYVVGFFVPDHQELFSGGATNFYSATPVTVQAGGVAISSADLPSLPGISGTVTALDTGEPINGTWVCAAAGDGGGSCQTTNRDGKYDLDLPDGTYRVWFEADHYVSQYYDDAADSAHASNVTVEGSLVHGVDAALEDAGSITGQVTTNDGHGNLNKAEVCALGASSKECVDPDSSGDYEFLRLAPGAYKVRFSLNGYFTQFYDDKATEAEAESVTVTANHESGGVDATLVAEEAPTNIIPPFVSGVGKVGETLSCSNGVWTGNPPSFTYEYFWFRGEEEEEIEGAELSTYRLGFADAGKSVFCAAVATNSDGTEYEFSSNEIDVAGIGILTVTKTGGGTGTVSSAPVGIDCGVSCSALFEAATVVTLTAAADSGSEFTGWSGDCSGTGACALTLGPEAEVVANFAKTRSGDPGGRGSHGSSNPPATPAPTTSAPVRTPKKKKPHRCKKGFHKAKHKGKVRCVKAKPKAKKRGKRR